MKGLKKHCNNATILARFLALILSTALALGLASCENASNNPALLAALGTPPVTNPSAPTTGGGTETPTTNGEGQNESEEKPLTFLEDWEKMEFLYINEGTRSDGTPISKKIDAPWNKKASSTLMPDNIRFDIKKSNGWEVAFNLMNQDGFPDMNYFGLYNKYTGVLRFFYYYNKDVAAYTNDFCFEVILGSDGNNVPAYYSALNYGIPMDANVKNVNLLGSGKMAKTFHLLITPYSGIDRRTMMQGWYAFDIDMSAYTGKSFYTDGSSMQIAFKANNTTNVSLGTDIIGKIYGDINATIDRTQLAASSGGVGGIISSILGCGAGLGDTTASSLRNIENKLCNGGILGTSVSLNDGLNYLSMIAKAGMFVYNQFAGEETQNQLLDKLNGKLELTCNLTADTSGYLESAVSTNVKQITLGKTVFNPESNIGKGVWNINTSPVIYVLSDRALCEVTRGASGNYSERDFWYYYDKEARMIQIYNNMDWRYVTSMRLPYFYDPTSFEVEINKEAFPDASDIKIFSYCGLYAQNFTENTIFRNALGIEKPAISIFIDGKDYEPDGLHWPFGGLETNCFTGAEYPFKTRRFVKCANDTYKEADIKFDGVNIPYEYITPSIPGYRKFYGQKMQLFDNSSACDFIIEPQIFYTREYGTGFYDLREIPEMYVIIMIEFKSGGKTFFYSRKYLPKYEVVSYEKAKEIANQIHTRTGSQSEKIMLSNYTTSIDKKIQILGQDDFTHATHMYVAPISF